MQIPGTTGIFRKYRIFDFPKWNPTQIWRWPLLCFFYALSVKYVLLEFEVSSEILVVGLIGIIIAMTLLLYRVNMRTRHHRQIQDHIETIHAILGKCAKN